MSNYRKYTRWLKGSLLAGSLLMYRCGVEKPSDIVQAEKLLPEKIDYNLHVKPILSEKCFFCHGPDKNNLKAGLQLATREGALAVIKDSNGKHAIVPGKLGQSQVYHRITTTDQKEMMPPSSSNRELTSYEKAVLVRWIEQGAEYKPHWAFIKPSTQSAPTVKDIQWPRNSIDNFVLDNLERKGLKPAPEADKETLLRRVTLDLTGLPPTVEEVDTFLTDPSPRAYEKVVARLLASPHYGEKMAVGWLDLARFADTHGYSQDSDRPMWPWRDWVIKAFNENLSFERFTTWQLAGDLLPNPTREQRLATGFNRNHPQNGEGGIVNEEFRVEYVMDRTNTFGTSFLGLTTECARCHDHKFDPISQKNYYQLSGFFNQVDEAGQISYGPDMPVPTMLLTEARHDSLLAFINGKISKTESTLDSIVRKEKTDVEQWQLANGKNPPFDRTRGLQAHYSFDKLVKGHFVNGVSAENKGTVAGPLLAEGKSGSAFQSNGDDILTLEKVGIFRRANPFSIGCWVKIPREVAKGVIFHKGSGDITHNFRGYYLNLRDNKIELLMAHTWPYNNLVKLTRHALPKEKWLHLTMTYDGSSLAKGLKLYIDGKEAEMVTEKDNLYKDIIFHGRSAFGEEPSLQIGADVRGTGFKNGLVDELSVYERELTAPEVFQLVRLSDGGTEINTPAFGADALSRYYFANVSTAYQRQTAALQKLRQQHNKVVEEVPEAMVMDEMKQKRPTYVLKRGIYDAHGEEVQPGTPESVLPFPNNLPANRLGLAKWLFSPDNPLTARVVVNRYWQNYFGKGIQRTANDFGNQGALPSHPELLDWLALRFTESGWDVKAMQKLIGTSATYRQSSYASPGQLEEDPDNQLLARGPAFRLTAEMVRDNALAASGLLTSKIGGPSVKPYQPEGLWAMNNAVYVPDKGENLYRRSLYTFWKRTNPPPSMNTFDAPLRSSCLVQRQQTSTPLQALVLLNDPQFVEAAKAVAERASLRHSDLKDRLFYTYRLLISRSPQEREVAILQKLYRSEYEKFKRHPEKMKGWLNTGAYKVSSKADPADLAAGAVVASTVMNSDAFITRR